MKRKSKLSTAQSHQLKIALDTVRNPSKALLGGPSLAEAREIVRKLTGMTEQDEKPFESLKDSHGI